MEIHSFKTGKDLDKYLPEINPFFKMVGKWLARSVYLKIQNP
jgi:hypothetical protein